MSETTHTDLIEQMAALISFSEFSMPHTGTPASYWEGCNGKAKADYRKDARHFLAAIRGKDWRLVPQAMTENMRQSALLAHSGVRTEAGAARLWSYVLSVAPNYRMVEDPTP